MGILKDENMTFFSIKCRPELEGFIGALKMVDAYGYKAAMKYARHVHKELDTNGTFTLMPIMVIKERD